MCILGLIIGLACVVYGIVSLVNDRKIKRITRTVGL
jgi:hypothetical protein